jgi:ethanolamine utilization protein EutN
MYLGVVTGTVVAERKAAGLEGTKLLLVQPVDDTGKHTGDVQVAVDTVRAGVGDQVYLVGSREAALACDPWFVPVDAAIVGIVDDVNNPERAALPEHVDDDPTEATPSPPARKAPARANRDKQKTGDV